MFHRLFKSEHQYVEDLLSAYLDGELSRRDKARVEKHLARCAACAQNLHTLRQTVALLKELPPVAVPRSLAIRPAQVAQRVSVLRARRTYGYLRAATVLATVLFAVVVAGDVFLTGLAPRLAPARAPEVIEREVSVEEVVVETVVVEKEAPATVEVEKEVLVEKEAAYEATPLPAPVEKKVRAPQRLATPAVTGKGIAPSAGPSATPEIEALVEAPRALDEERIEATPSPAQAVIATQAVPTPTAIAEVLPSPPLPQKPIVRAVARPSRPELVLLRAVEAGLLLLVFVLAVATMVVKRRQGDK